ncbi:MAG: glycosyltransferase family 39 protein [Acidobacteria bacterium]|nr:glycosyltransferase family 39 protein [Acidobacteriota bacterium]
MPPALTILLAAAFTVAACVAAGKLLLRVMRVRFHHGEAWLFAFVAGAACWSAVVFALAAARLARRSVFLAAGVLVILAALRWGRRSTQSPETLPPRLSRPWKVVFGVVFGAFTVLYFFNALAPEVSPDGSTYHLGLVARYLREHGFTRITTSMYANLSQGMEMLFLFAFAFGKHSAAALVHFAFLLALPLAMLAYGRRIGHARAGAVGALLVYASPLAGVDGISAYNDVAVACVLFTLFYLLEIWEKDPRPGWLAAAGLLAGFGYALKYTALLAVPYALGRVGWTLWRNRRPLVRPLALTGACALLMIAPWMAKNWIWLGNPVSPFLNQVFPNPHVRVSFEQEYARQMRHYAGLSSYWAVPLEATVRGEVLNGFLGPAFLLAPLGLLALRRREGRQLLLAALVFALTYPANVGTRFLLPALPFVSLAMGLAAWRWMAPALVLAHAVASWPSVSRSYCGHYAWRVKDIPWEAALRRTPEERFLAERQPRYTLARTIEEHVPPYGQVLVFNQTPNAYTSRELLLTYESGLGNLLHDILLAPRLMDEQPVRAWRFSFPPQAVRKLRVLQTASSAPGEWHVREFRVFHGEAELERKPAWRLRAHPNPWDVPLAFDNTLVTRWRSWQSMFPGMYLELSFGAPQVVDAVKLECTPDQGPVRLQVEAETAPGVWKTLATQAVITERRRPDRLRRAAVEEVKARGVDYLLLYESDIVAEEFWKQRRRWGIAELAHVRGARLYRLD